MFAIFKKLVGWLTMLDFEVSTVIDTFRRWCNLNFGPMRDQLKSPHFSEKIGMRDHIFTFYTNFLE